MKMDELMGACDAPLVGPRRLQHGEQAFIAGAKGLAWVVVSGALRLDRAGAGDEEASFAGIAIKGDVLGAETLLTERYAFTATALSACLLEPWQGTPGVSSMETLLQLLSNVERRSTEALRMRCGKAADRVRYLIQLLAPEQPGAVLPALKHIAEMTALRVETVSRTLGLLQREACFQQGFVRKGRRPTSSCLSPETGAARRTALP